MPLVAQAVGAYASGLLLGFSTLGAGALALAALAALVGCLRRERRLIALSACVAAGVCAASASAARAAACRERANRGRQFEALLGDVASPGAFVPARVTFGGCALEGRLAVDRGRASAGDRVIVVGRGIASRRGLTVAHAAVIPVDGGSALSALKARSGARIDRLFGEDAPLVRALLIADTRDLSPELRDRFAAAGIIHMLSISGLHVGIIAMAILLVARALRLPPHVASTASAGITALYVAMIGSPPPAVRSGVMLTVGLLSRMLQRPVSTWGVLSLGALVPLVEARTALDLGYQLSVLGMASLVASGSLRARWIAPRWAGWRGALAAVALTSSLATVVTAPLVAWTFGRVSLIAPLTNIVAAPIVSLLQPALFAAIVFPITTVARIFAAGAHPLLIGLDAVARAGAALPFASIGVAPTLAAALCWLVATVALLVACVSWDPGRGLVGAVAAAAGAVWIPALPIPGAARGLELHAIDVGQGDAIALRTPAGRWVLVDAGRSWLGGDAGRSTVVPYLRRLGGELRVFVLTHPHADHAGGARSVLGALRPAEYWDGAFAGTSEAYRGSLVTAESLGVRWHRVHPGDSLDLDGVRLRILAPDSAYVVGLDDPNEASVVLMAEYQGVRMLLMGDAERGEEALLVGGVAEGLHADVLKVGHHGSSTSSSEPFLDAVRPRLAVISVGAGNAYGHPSAVVLRDLARHRAAVLRTDMLGGIVVRTEHGVITIDDAGDEWTLSPDSSSR